MRAVSTFLRKIPGCTKGSSAVTRRAYSLLKLNVEGRPGGVVVGGGDDGFDEGHAPDAILNGWEVVGWGVVGQGGIFHAGADSQGEVFVDVSEGFEVSFGVGWGSAAGGEGGR